MQNKNTKLNIKNNGEVFTPNFLVNIILEQIDYNKNNANILQKHIIDNSCGNGAFLCEIVKRYCQVSIKNNISNLQIENDLSNYIHGIEINKDNCIQCIKNLNTIAKSFNLNLQNISWNILNEDALLVNEFNNKMDFVVANPPYVRVHNLTDYKKIKQQFSFIKNGMLDLYLIFFELGFKMLNTEDNINNAKMIYITPSSWLNSLAGNVLRNYIVTYKNLKSLIDLEHQQTKKKNTTYTIISEFTANKKNDLINYFKLNNNYEKVKIAELNFKDFYFNNTFYLAQKNVLNKLQKILNCNTKFVVVKNGFATLADNIFIQKQIKNFGFDNYIIPTLKASTAENFYAFFPYDKDGKAITKSELFDNKNNQNIANYLNNNKQFLLKNMSEESNKNWYLYGRSQAIKDVYKDKIAVNTIIKNVESIKINFVPKGKGIFSGLYIISNSIEFTLNKENINLINNILKSNDFIEYLQCLKKYKSGGYYTFNSKELECFLNYKIGKILYYTENKNVFNNTENLQFNLNF